MFSKNVKDNITTSNTVLKNRVVVIGLGSVGTSTAYAMMIQGAASEIVLVDLDKNKCEGEASDLEHGIPFVHRGSIRAGSYEDCKDARIILICAGVGSKPGQSRLELIGTNANIIREIVGEIKKRTNQAIIMMVTNPLDVLTHIALKESGFSPNLVFGSGTTLDSARFRYYLAQEFNIAPESIGAYLIGEHGDSQVPVYSHCNVMGEPISSLPNFSHEKLESAYNKTKNAAAQIISKKGHTCYAIGLAVSRIVQAILHDENHVFPVSTYLNGEYGLSDVCLSVPAVIGSTGIKKILAINLQANEKEQLHRSAEIIRETIKQSSKTI